MNSFTINPIALFHCQKIHPFEAASQGHLDQSEEQGVIELLPGNNFEQALIGLEGMTHLWVIFAFHQNQNWKPMVKTPRGPDHKIGVFATRSPYRPNAIGLSLLEIQKIEGRKIWVKGFDLLDQTPIFDLKPFHPEADVPQSSAQFGWIEALGKTEYQIKTSLVFEMQNQFLNENKVTQILSFCKQQLRFKPLDYKMKRVEQLGSNTAVISYRTWRILFTIESQMISLERIFSGYSQADFENSEDTWGDKKLHLAFAEIFPTNESTNNVRSDDPIKKIVK